MGIIQKSVKVVKRLLVPVQHLQGSIHMKEKLPCTDSMLSPS